MADEKLDVAHVEWNDVQALWDEMGQRNWLAFAQTLREHRGKGLAMDDKLADRLISYSEGMERDHHDFPDSALELDEMLNERLIGKGVDNRTDR